MDNTQTASAPAAARASLLDSLQRRLRAAKSANDDDAETQHLLPAYTPATGSLQPAVTAAPTLPGLTPLAPGENPIEWYLREGEKLSAELAEFIRASAARRKQEEQQELMQPKAPTHTSPAGGTLIRRKAPRAKD